MAYKKELPSNVQLVGTTTTRHGSLRPVFEVQCLNCGENRKITRRDHAVRLSMHPCKRCSNKNNHPSGMSGPVRVAWFNQRVADASLRSLEFTLTIDDVVDIYNKQKGLCSLTGWPVSWSTSGWDHTASLDRIDNAKGYTPDNVHIVHKRVNMARGVLELEEFIALCSAVHKNKNL